MERQHARRFVEPQLENFIIGQLGWNEGVIRDPWSKWFVSKKQYSPRHYPTFAHGPTYGLTVAAAGRLYNASVRLPYFYLEDVCITGLCAHKANVSRVSDSLFKYIH